MALSPIIETLLICCFAVWREGEFCIPIIRSSNESVLIKALLRKYNGINLSQNSNISFLFQKNEKTFSVRIFHHENMVRYLEIKFMRLWQHILRLDYLGVFNSHTSLPWASSKLSIIVCVSAPVLALEVVYAPGLLFRYSLDYNLKQRFASDLISLDLRETADFHFDQASFFCKDGHDGFQGAYMPV